MREVEMLKLIDHQAQIIARLEERIAQLERDSGNSNQPPSSDPPYKPKKKRKSESGKDNPGAKKGHKANQRKAFSASRVDEIVHHEIPENERPSHLVPIEDDVLVCQQVSRIKAIVTEHRIQRYRNIQTGKIVLAPHSFGLRKLLSPEAAAAVACLKTDGRMSISSLHRFCKEVLDLKISRGCLSQAVTEAGKACDKAYKQIRSKLQDAKVIGMDETTHWHRGERLWMWTAQTLLLSLLRVENTRAHDEISFFLEDDWQGVLVSDDMGAYKCWCRSRPNVKRQLCHAHLYREVKGLQDHPRLCVRDWADKTKRIYDLWWKALKKDSMHRAKLIWEWMSKHCQKPPPVCKAKNLSKRLVDYQEDLLRCLEDPAVPATNNASERALRQVVIQRKLTFGTRSEAGIIAWERLFSLLDTCRKQGLSAYHYLCDAMAAMRNGVALPELELRA